MNEIFSLIVGSNLVTGVLMFVLTKITSKKDDDLKIAEKIKALHLGYIDELEGKISKLTEEVAASTKASLEDKKEVEKLSSEVKKLNDKITALVNSNKEKDRNLKNWEEEILRRDQIHKNDRKLISELYVKLEKYEKDEAS